jgi:hypothetical protein
MPISDEDHPIFNRPSDNARLWRYMDLSKYLALVSTSSLWFSSAIRLGDPHEGSMSQANIRLRPVIYKDPITPEILEQQIRFRKNLLACTYINCWHHADYESAAMWQLYKNDHGIAIVSNYARMKTSLKGESGILVGHVNYSDYENDWIPEGNFLAPFMHKRRSFEHEQEVRAIVTIFPLRTDSSLEGGSGVDFRIESPEGLIVPTDLGGLIQEVRVDPQAPKWFRQAVEDVTRSFGLTYPVRQSELDVDPVY